MPIPQPENQTTKDPAAQFASLPGPLRSFLLSKESDEILKSLYKKFNFPQPTIIAVATILGDIVYGDLPYSDLLETLIDETGLDKDQAKKFALEVSGQYFLAIEELINADVWKQIEAWGGQPSSYQTKKVVTRKITNESLVGEIIKESRLELSPRLMKRLEFVITSHISGVRDDREVRNILMRSEKVGGVDLPKEAADQMINIINLKLADAQIVTEAPAPTLPKILPPPAAPAPQPLRPVALPKERPSLDEALPAAKKFAGPRSPAPTKQTDEEEIKAFKTAMDGRLTKETQDHLHSLEACTESVMKESQLSLQNPALTERFKNIVNARLRDLRDALETKSILAAPASGTGLGLDQKTATRISNLIEAEFLAFQGQMGAKKTREHISFEKIKQRAKTYQKTAAIKKEQGDRDRILHRVAQKSKILKEQEVMLPPHPPGLEHPQPEEIKKLQPVKAREPFPAKPKIRPVLSPASVGPKITPKPSMQDVNVARLVTGPIEEINNLTMIQFRRLSKDPREATLKIRDKIELLKEGGFEQYNAGVRAWQSSEPNKLYLELMRAALDTGSAVPEIIQKRLAENQPSLTPEEFRAILELNSGLRLSA